ncbi:hypothetical protein SJ05684_c34660 [Sinorhizobium sojae CCBAU 05684]|uniref:Uncharacterized protein n=1 Tax=Sinorhizobium sojae CCBAU 05684 TaxID=716928 RepID=A0A249PGN2_9HYPH|nr:hypothetical protein SJ05684_c34660 [Sinorhizobium sojae CCBAU 05684]
MRGPEGVARPGAPSRDRDVALRSGIVELKRFKNIAIEAFAPQNR